MGYLGTWCRKIRVWAERGGAGRDQSVCHLYMLTYSELSECVPCVCFQKK